MPSSQFYSSFPTQKQLDCAVEQGLHKFISSHYEKQFLGDRVTSNGPHYATGPLSCLSCL